MNRSVLAIGGAAGLVLALISGPAFSAEAKTCYQNVTTTELTWNVENHVQTSEAVPASYEPLYDFDDSGDTGHYEATAEGLHIWTEGTTSEDQVRLLQRADVPLADVTSAGVDFTNTSGGGVPSAQLLIDSPSIPGLIDGTLVAEAIYGDKVWLTAGSSDALKALAPHTGSGSGSNWWGTMAEWGAAVPDATIVGIGFSLGSGVLGDGILHSVDVGDVSYPFVKETPAVPAVFEWVVVGSGQGKTLPTSDDEDVRFVQTGTVDVVTQVEVACPVDNLPPTG